MELDLVMLTYFIRHFFYFLTVLLGVCIVGFFVIYLTGDPALMMAPPSANLEQIESIRISMGLNKPVMVQFGIFMRDLFIRGDFGMSFRYGRPAFEILIAGFKNTYILAGYSFLVATAFGISMGILSGINKGNLLDTIFTTLSVLGQSMPLFWTAILGIMFFAVHLKWLPVSGMGSWKNVILPAFTAGLYSAARISSLTRSSMIDVLSQDYVRTARAKGLRETLVVTKHAFLNSMIPVVTMLGLELGTMLAGAVVTEVIFAWPGIGRIMANAVIQRDFPLVRGGLILIGVNFLIINFSVDLIYSLLDPRIRVE
jgi:ABC-type dipeptide/oligopeptide/nickel transport system permease component